MENKQDNFVRGITALIVSQGIIKILGMIYSVYLTNKNGFGDAGNAIYMSGYQIYALLLSISSIGIPNAISKLVSEKMALKDFKGADRIFKVAIIVFSGIGFAFSQSLFFGAGKIANVFLQIPEAEYTLKALAPAIFLVSVSSVIRGYCNGRNQIDITAKSQTLEQVVKSFLTIAAVEIISVLSDSNTQLMASSANFATTLATLISLMYIFYINEQKRKKIIFQKKYYQKEKIWNIIRKILRASIPMTISSLLSSTNKIIDSITVVRILKRNIGENLAKLKYGIISSKVDLLVNMPFAFNIAFATALVPEIARSLIKNDFENINKKVAFSIKVTILIGIPCMCGIFVYSKEIFNLLFPNASTGSELLKLSSIIIMVGTLTQTINGILQGIGKNKVPAIGLFFGVIVKIFANIILIPIKGIDEKGVIIGNIFCYLIAFIISYKSLVKSIKLDLDIKSIVIKPCIINFIMISASYWMYVIIKKVFLYEYIAFISGIIFAVIVYVIFIIKFRIFSEEEIKMIKF